MKKLPFFTLLLFFFSSTMGQDKAPVANNSFQRSQFEAGLTLSTDGNTYTSAASATQYWSIAKRNRKFKIGLGARLSSSFGGSELEYITADAELTSGKTGPAVFFADQVIANIDTVSLSNTQTNALNVLLALHYDFNNKFGVEFNIDLLGLTFGERQRAALTYDDGQRKLGNAYPTVGNVLLISDNDIGTLNSEFFFSYLHKNRIRFKVGGVFLFNEYTLTDPVVYVNNSGKVIDTDRYRNKSLQFGIGVNYVLKYFRK